MMTSLKSLTVAATIAAWTGGAISATAAQFARPDGTVTTGSWTAVTAPTLHAATDETTANGDTDYANATVNTTMELSLSNVVDPQTHTGFVVRVAAKSSGSGSPERFDCALYQGGTLISSFANQSLSRTGYVIFVHNVATNEAAAITDYTDLRVRITSANLGGGESMRTTWIEMEVPDVPVVNPPTLTSPTAPFATITTTSAVLGATITADGGGAITSRGTAWNLTGPAITNNPLAEGGTAVGAYSHARAALPAGTLIHFRGYAVNAGGTGYSPDGSFYTEPDVQPSTVTFSNVTTTGMRVNWVAGSGAGTLVVMKQGGVVNSDPVDGTEHAASATFGSGSQLGTGNYVVYRGSANQVDVSGLAAGATYYVALYAFAGSTTQVNYQQDAPATGQRTTQSAGPSVPTLTAPTASSVASSSAQLGATITTNGGAAITQRGTLWNTTGAPITQNMLAEGGTATGAFTHARSSLPAATLIHFRGYASNSAGVGYSPDGSFYTEPSVQASAITVTNVTNASATISWTPGNGSGTIVVMKRDTAVAASPVDGTQHAANPAFGSGADLGGGSYVVYLGPGSSVDVTGMTPTTTYHVAAFALAGSGSLINYLQTAPAAGSLTTTLATTSTKTPSHNSQYAPFCASCHAHGLNTSYLARGAEQEARCKTCHNPTGIASNKSAITMHVHGGTNAIDCGTCHEVHGEVALRTSYDPVTGVSTVNLSFLRADMSTYSPTNASGQPIWSNMLFQIRPQHFAFSNTPYNGACQVCHTATDYHRNNNLSNHTHQVGGDCTGCHGHDAGFAPTGGGSCIDCHNKAQNNGDGVPASGRRAVVGEFGLRSHHVTGTVANADCEVCHEMTQHQQGSVRLFNADNTNIVYVLTNGANPATSSTAAAQLTAFCLACHDTNGAAGSAPFSDNRMPPVVSNAAWTASAHRVAFNTCYGNGTTFGCHSSGHGSALNNLLAPFNSALDTTTRYEEEEGFCFGCHKSGGVSTNNVMSSFSGTIRWVADASGSFSSTNLNDRHDVQYAAQARSKAKIECVDCHNPHADTKALPVRPDPDPTDGRRPGTGQVMTNVDFYTEWCLDCHDGSYPSTVTAPSTAIENIRTTHLSDAHGAADGAASLRSGYGYVDNMTVRCLDCHTTKHVSTNRNLFALKDIVTGTNGITAVPSDGGAGYSVTNNNVSNFKYNGYDWCNTCHTSSMGNGKPNCFNCHYHSTRF